MVMAGEHWSRMNHSHDRRFRAGRARHEREDVIEMEREAREMKSRAAVLTCSDCGATNIADPVVSEIQCSGCAAVLNVRA